MPASAYERFRAELANHLAWSGYTVALAYGDHTREMNRQDRFHLAGGFASERAAQRLGGEHARHRIDVRENDFGAGEANRVGRREKSQARHDHGRKRFAPTSPFRNYNNPLTLGHGISSAAGFAGRSEGMCDAG